LRIQSKFKDYYDFVGQRYGEDPDVVYTRGRIDVAPAGNVFALYSSKHGREVEHFVRHDLKLKDDEWTRATYGIELIFAADYVFPVVRITHREHDAAGQHVERVSYRPLDVDTHHWLSTRWDWQIRARGKENEKQAKWDSFHRDVEDFRKRHIVPMQVKLHAPVLHVSGAGLYDVVPILRDFGIPSLVTPEQMWQAIYDCFVNRLRRNPDKEVPVQLSNEERIEKAGFDLKTSFRNPIKWGADE